MPSKNRKHSSSKTPPPSSSSSQPETNEEEEEEEDVSLFLLEKASIQYPSLISKQNTLISKITDVQQPTLTSRNTSATIWLSESAITASSSSLRPNSIVSVSLASSKKKLFGASAVDLLVDDEYDGLDKRRSNDAGCYFALARVFPSCKVLKNGMRLSWSQACTLGNPSAGKIAFVSPIQTHSINCSNLYLQVVPSKNAVVINGNSTSKYQHDQLENGKIASPKTPSLYRSKLNSPVVCSTPRSQDSGSKMHSSNETIVSTYGIEEALENEKSRELLQTCASLWLRDRLLSLDCSPFLLQVSKFGFGCMGLTGAYNDPVSDDVGITIIKDAFHKGVTFFDTSDVYGPNTNEVLVGKALKQLPREKIQLATKFGIVRIEPTQVVVKGTPDYVRDCCEASLKRLDVDYIDLYYQHRVDTSTPIEDIMHELKKLVEEGKIKYIGLSEASPDTIRRAHAVHPISALQMEWLLWTRDIEEEIVPLCRELGIGLVSYSPLGRGFFAGKAVVESLPANSFLVSHPRFTGENFDKNKILYSRITYLAAKYGCTPAQLALAWVLHQGDDIVPIPELFGIKI